MSIFPDEWIDYIFRRRRESIVLMTQGKLDAKSIYLEFTRTLPAIVSYGPAGLNASIKMVGLIHKEEYFDDTYNKLFELINKKPKMREVLSFLLNEYYVEEKIDFGKLFTLDLARKRTWANLKNGGEAILLFFTPPETSYMVKARVTVHMDDKIYELANALHDLFHVIPIKGEIISRSPTYLFHIEEIWNKSADKFGVKIYP